MEIDCLAKLSALAHDKRLAVFRLLVRRYPDAVPAGEISAALGFKPNTASAYLAALTKAQLISQKRSGNSLRYTANLEGVRGLFSSLLSDCCNNRPDACLFPALDLPRQPSLETPLKVLFLCSANAARSIMAEALLNHLGEGRFQAFSAGTKPQATPDSTVLQLLGSRGHDTTSLRSKSLQDLHLPETMQMDLVFTLCDQAANEHCPSWPNHPISAHWGLSDPLQAKADQAAKNLALHQSYAILKERIQRLVALPYAALDRISLQQQCDSIGTIGDDR